MSRPRSPGWRRSRSPLPSSWRTAVRARTPLAQPAMRARTMLRAYAPSRRSDGRCSRASESVCSYAQFRAARTDRRTPARYARFFCGWEVITWTARARSVACWRASRREYLAPTALQAAHRPTALPHPNMSQIQVPSTVYTGIQSEPNDTWMYTRFSHTANQHIADRSS